MILWCECQAIENPDEAIVQVTDAPHIDVKDRYSGTCVICTEFHDQDYAEKIEEFQFYLKMVRKMARPGCSPETLNVVLSSMSSLIDTLSLMSSKHYIRPSL